MQRVDGGWKVQGPGRVDLWTDVRAGAAGIGACAPRPAPRASWPIYGETANTLWLVGVDLTQLEYSKQLARALR